jgi:hypothetical protein
MCTPSIHKVGDIQNNAVKIFPSFTAMGLKLEPNKQRHKQKLFLKLLMAEKYLL